MLTSPNLAAIPTIRHGFFGRQGGVSDGIYTSLNAGPGSSDNPQHVKENRERIAKALDAEPEQLCTQYQVHSALVTEVTQPWAQPDSPQTDAMVTKTPGIVLGILTADCGPVLFADPENGVIGAAHAGWKGAVGGVLEATIDHMVKLGAKKQNIIAALGPTIAQKSYEVSDSFLTPFKTQNIELNDFFAPSSKVPGKYHFNLPAYIGHRLRQAGLSNVNLLANDTCFEEDDFFSYRRSTLRHEPDYGRQISAIMLVK